MSMVVEVDRACPATLPQPLRSPWYHFLSQIYNYFRYPSSILEFLREGNVEQSRRIHQWIPYPQNIGIATKIASMSVSDAKLLVLPVWGTVSTSGFYLMVFYIVWQCRRKCKGSGVPENCVVAAEITLKCLRTPSYYYFRFWWIYTSCLYFRC